MLTKLIQVLVLLVCATHAGAGEPSRFPQSQWQSVPWENVELRDDFWRPRIESLRTTGLPALWDTAEEQGKVDNFRIVAGLTSGRIRLYNAPDSDVYKLVEATAYVLHQTADAPLQARVQQVVNAMAAAQDASGYLHTQYMLPRDDPRSPNDNPGNRQRIATFGYGPTDRWAAQADRWPYAYSQLYCAGHLMEAAAAWQAATGDDTLLAVAVKLADHIGREFGSDPAQFRAYADHPEIEIGLLALYEQTGDEKYAALAERFARYGVFARPVDIGDGHNRQPLDDQRYAFGHAVRTGYVYTGATGVLRFHAVPPLRTAIDALWRNVTAYKMYVHGGVGNGTPYEQHGLDDALPLGATYSESCASIAQAQWNHQLNLLTGDGRYASIVEWEMYNSALAGISLDGVKYLYCNKLDLGMQERRDAHSGVREHFLFCCPSKLPIFVGGIGRWIYARDDQGLTINQYISSQLATTVGGQQVELRQTSGLPWNGKIEIEVLQAPADPMELRLRLPSYVTDTGPLPDAPYHFAEPLSDRGGVNVQINGESHQPAPAEAGYVTIARVFEAGDVLRLEFPLPPRRILTDDRITANRGRVGLSRGPLLYCLEGADSDYDPHDLVIPREASLNSVWDPACVGGVTKLVGQGRLQPDDRVQGFTAIPYFAWQHRGVHPLVTLPVEDPRRAQAEQQTPQGPINTDG